MTRPFISLQVWYYGIAPVKEGISKGRNSYKGVLSSLHNGIVENILSIPNGIAV